MGTVREHLTRWWSNRRIRRTVGYTLLLILFILISPYLALVWRIILYGDVSDQTILIAIVGITVYIRALWRMCERKERTREGEKETKLAGTRNGRKPARKRKRKTSRR